MQDTYRRNDKDARRKTSLTKICTSHFTASYQQLLWSPNFIGVPEGPLGRVWLSLPHFVLLQLYWNWLDFRLD